MIAHSYRADIDGLRAIAIGTVVLFHAFPALLPGGFVGVDIFFVISGYLITGILLREREEHGRIDFAQFYARRVRRLLPALLVVVAATLALGWWLLPATGERQSLAQSALAALFFVSNIFFAFQPSGYFGGPAEGYPLLHTWTLAVEEQFYIVWPLLILFAGWVALRTRHSLRASLWALLALLFVSSLALSILGTYYRPAWAFYLTPFRGWEFAIGAALALVREARLAQRRALALPVALAGLMLIALSVTLIDESSPFPGWIAAVPTFGTAALIAAGTAAPGNPVARLLSWRPFVYVGTLSYGWYLWHWPLLALLHSHDLGAPSVAAVFAAVLLSFLLSAASLHWIEMPIRRQQWPAFRRTPQSLASGGAILAAGAVLALLTLFVADAQLRASPRLQAIAAAQQPVAPVGPVDCVHWQATLTQLAPMKECLVGDVRARDLVVLIGDSHADHLTRLFDQWGKAAGVAVLPRTRGGCRPMEGRDALVGLAPTPANLETCAWFREAVSRELAALAAERPITLVVAVRWPDSDVADTHGDESRPAAERVTTEIAKLAGQASAQGFRLVLVLDTPALPHAAPECLSRRKEAACALSRAVAEQQRDEASEAIRSFVATHPGIGLIDPLDALCDANWCGVIAGDTILYHDTTHLTAKGSLWLAARLKPQLDAALLAPVPPSTAKIAKRASAAPPSPVSTAESPHEPGRRAHRKGVIGA